MQAAERVLLKAKESWGGCILMAMELIRTIKNLLIISSLRLIVVMWSRNIVFGLMLINGEVSKNEEMAFRYIKMAASGGGDPDAMSFVLNV